MRTAAVLLSLCAIADALAPDVPRMGSTLSRRGAMATFASGFLGASSLLGGPSASMAGDLPGDGFVTSPSGLKVKVLRSGTAGDLITNGLKAGDYIRMEVKGYTGGFGKEGKLVDSTEVHFFLAKSFALPHIIDALFAIAFSENGPHHDSAWYRQQERLYRVRQDRGAVIQCLLCDLTTPLPLSLISTRVLGLLWSAFFPSLCCQLMTRLQSGIQLGTRPGFELKQYI